MLLDEGHCNNYKETLQAEYTAIYSYPIPFLRDIHVTKATFITTGEKNKKVKRIFVIVRNIVLTIINGNHSDPRTKT